MSWTWSDWDNMSSYWVLNIVHSLPESPLQWTNFHATKRSFWWNLARFRFKTHLTSCKNCCNESHADKLSWSEITLSSKEKKLLDQLLCFVLWKLAGSNPSIHPSISLQGHNSLAHCRSTKRTQTTVHTHIHTSSQLTAHLSPKMQVLCWTELWNTHLQILKGPTVSSYVAFFSRDTSSPQRWYSDKAVDKICLRV